MGFGSLCAGMLAVPFRRGRQYPCGEDTSMKWRWLAVGVMLVVAMAGAGCRRGQPAPDAALAPLPSLPSGPLYTACNLWYEHPQRMSCINYQVGALIPAGSEVRGVEVRSGRRASITFTVVASGITHTIQFGAKYHPGKTVEDLRARLFTGKTLDELTAGFTDQEKECVRVGAVAPGISREAVLVTYGYPPEHRTPLLTGATWTYWINRFATRAVTFGQDGKVVSVR